MAAEPEPDPTDKRLGNRRAERHHAVIAGTGRAGTSFLVRFLSECGLDTGSRSGFDERARAGLEHHLLDDEAPYVVKDPWLFVYCHDIDPDSIRIDALLVPIRELLASATSRILQDRIAMADGHLGRGPMSDVNGVVTGGVVYSLDPVDEARILAVGFHRLIHWATVREIPLFLLEFPRTVGDPDYLIDTLWPWLHAHCDRERAAAAFDAVADPGMVRIAAPGNDATSSNGSVETSSLDRDAMVILLNERNSQLASTEDQLVEMRESLAMTHRELADVRAAIVGSQDELAGTRTNLGNVQRQLELAMKELEQRHAELHERTQEMADLQGHCDAQAAELAKLYRTLSWRLTRPLRAMKRAGRRAPAKG